jgi:hypothetical protein
MTEGCFDMDDKTQTPGVYGRKHDWVTADKTPGVLRKPMGCF